MSERHLNEPTSVFVADAVRAKRAARADLMVRLVQRVLRFAPPMQAVIAGVALDQLRAMVSTPDVDVPARSSSPAERVGRISACDADMARPIDAPEVPSTPGAGPVDAS